MAANHLCPVLLEGSDPAAIDAAARATQEERLPEVTTIQRAQQGPPAVLFGRAWWNRLVVDGLVPLLVRTGIAQRAFGAGFRRFAAGVATVRLEA